MHYPILYFASFKELVWNRHVLCSQILGYILPQHIIRRAGGYPSVKVVFEKKMDSCSFGPRSVPESWDTMAMRIPMKRANH